MGCANCTGAKTLQPAKTNGGLYVVEYIGREQRIVDFGIVTGNMYSFGTSKREFYADYRDLVGLLQGWYGNELRVKP